MNVYLIDILLVFQELYREKDIHSRKQMNQLAVNTYVAAKKKNPRHGKRERRFCQGGMAKALRLKYLRTRVGHHRSRVQAIQGSRSCHTLARGRIWDGTNIKSKGTATSGK